MFLRGFKSELKTTTDETNFSFIVKFFCNKEIEIVEVNSMIDRLLSAFHPVTFIAFAVVDRSLGTRTD
jgi:hypothetical protein